MTLMLSFAILFVLLWTTKLSAQEPEQQATITEEQQVIKTYGFSDPDPIPIMSRSSMWGRGLKLYPYFFFDRMTHDGTDQAWNVVHLENPYIDVFVMPEEGGKIIGAHEKSTDNDFVYHNHVRKFRQIALRGPWTSGGIELNFGIRGHQGTTATPVDYVIRENPDGSVSCTVGTIDLPSRNQWRVTITVPPDKAYFETQSLFYNPMSLPQAYYVWMNGANRATDDLEIILPGTAYIGHNYGAPERPWPSTSPDLSLYSNHRYTNNGSYFVHGKFEDFAGGYWHDAKFGFGHWALYEDMPGQKMFRWPLSRQGAIWEDLLTDHDGQYFEPQMGRLFTQEDHEYLNPYTVDTWREVWFPYKDIGPMVKATPYGALNVTRSDDGVTLGFCALQALDEDLVVRAKGKEVFRDHLTLGTMDVYTRTLQLAVDKGDLQVDVGNKLSYTDDAEATTLTRPLNFVEYDESTAEGLYLAADRYHKGRDYDLALPRYLSCLEREPLHIRALTGLAELYCRRGEYETALTYAKKALQQVMYDPDANYIYGVISRNLGNLVDAKETLGWAARSMEYRSTAYCQMAEIYLLEGHLDLTLEYLRRSLKYNTQNIITYQTLATTHRLRSEPDEARQTLDTLLEIDPLNHIARFEWYLLTRDDADLEHFTTMIRNELPHETYLETAMYYVNLGLYDDALLLLDEAPEQATITYWQAYLLKDTDAGRSRKYLKKAAELSPYLVFPFREESIPVFQWAMDTQPDDWKAGYYLGLIYWGKRRYEDARALLNACGSQPDYAPFYIARSFLNSDTDAGKAIADVERAHELDPEDWKSWHHLIGVYNENGMPDRALTVARDAAARFPNEDVIEIDLANTFMNNKLYQECYAVLDTAKSLPYEGQRGTHNLFVRCQIYMAMEMMKTGDYTGAIQRLEGSKEYPERLGTGMPFNPDYRMQDYLIMLCYEKTEETSKAEEAGKRIYEYTLHHSGSRRARSTNRYFSALIFQQYDEPKQAYELLMDWKDPRPGDLMADIIELIETMKQ